MRTLRFLAGIALSVMLGGMHADAQLSAQDQALFNAIRANNIEQVKDALRSGANVEARDRNGYTPLLQAVYADGSADVVKLLLESHANVEAKDSSGGTPLIQAVRDGKADIVKLLLDNHANLEAKDNHGETALFWGISYDKPDVVTLLLANHANIEAKASSGDTPLTTAIHEGKADIVTLLLDDHADIEATGAYGETPLMWAAAGGKGEAEIVALLLKRGANEAAKTQSGTTAFDSAAHNLSCDTMLVLEHGVQSRTRACLTALAEANQKNPSYGDVVVRTAAAAAMFPPLPEIPEAAREAYVQANETYRTAQNNADIKSAIAFYNDALMKAPWFSDAWYNLSLAEEKLGDYDGAVSAMKAMQPLEAGSSNERRDLDRVYKLEADGKMDATKQAQQAQLNKAVDFLGKIMGGHTVDRFWLFKRSDGTLCSPSDASSSSNSCVVYGSVENGYASHDGTSIGTQVTVTAETDHVVLAVGAQRFCMPPNSVDLMQIPVVWAVYSPNMHVTDCNNPPGAVRNLGFSLNAVEPVAGGKKSAVNGMVMLSIEKCQDAECRHADMAVYWLKP